MTRRRRRDGQRRPTSRFGVGDLVAEAVAGIVQRPGRSALTMLGTILGIGALVAILGLSETASAQISKQFNVLDATQVTITDVGDTASVPAYDFPADADQKIDVLDGVVSAGVWWQLPEPSIISDLPGASGPAPSIDPYAITPGTLAAAGNTVVSGATFNSFDERTAQHVVVLSQAAASLLGVPSLVDQPAVFIGGQPFTVVGIVSGGNRLPQLGLGIVVPASTALGIWGMPSPANAAQMLIHTRLGAPGLIASQAPVALDPRDPSLLYAAAGFTPTSLRHAVTANLNSIFVVLALIALVIGAVGIANTTLVAILERTGEIGLRRALGARPRHIAAQFLAETTTIGLVGGVIAAALGAASTVGVAVERRWTAVLDPWYVIAAPFAGAAVGLVAGLYPSLRAALVQPAEALRR